jgi:hypothetical protein
MKARTGLKQRLVQFFTANPNEELSLDDMVVKFAANRRSLQNALSLLKEQGLVRRAVVYRGEKQ